jgi:two-component system LytT family response regulator
VSGPAAERPVRVLIVDDEPLNQLRIADLLRGASDVEVVGTAADGPTAVDAIRRLAPDLVFLDVQMPGMSGLEVISAVGVRQMPATIFVTAFDRYALTAFDLAAVDYLVKPYDDERFEEALRRARRLLALDAVDQLRGRLLAVLSPPALPAPAGPAAPAYPERIAVEIGGQVRPIAVADVECITADGPYAELHVGGRRYVIREAMQSLEDRLDPARFLRIHRSAIVRLDLVESLHRGAGGDGEVVLKGGRRLRVSRSRREALERWLGLPP